MGQSLSTDLRRRLARGVKQGKSRRAIAAQFKAARKTAVRLQKRYDEMGSVAPARQGRPPGSGKLGPHKDFVIAQVNARPDITMPDLAAVLKSERGVSGHPACFSKLLCTAGFTYKKRFWRRNSKA